MSKYIRLRDADDSGMVQCVTCGNYHHWKDLDAGHFFSKSMGNAAYFEESNIFPQCRSCNRFHEGNKQRYTLYMLDRHGREFVEALEAKCRRSIQYRLCDYEELEQRYKALAEQEMRRVG